MIERLLRSLLCDTFGVHAVPEERRRYAITGTSMWFGTCDRCGQKVHGR